LELYGTDLTADRQYQQRKTKNFDEMTHCGAHVNNTRNIREVREKRNLYMLVFYTVRETGWLFAQLPIYGPCDVG